MCIQLQSEARETERRSMRITVPTSNGKLWYTLPVRTRPESPDGEWTVEIDPVSSVNTKQEIYTCSSLYSSSQVYICSLH